nr:ribosomal protein L16, mitochondrial [Tanacetum cinerariifolium]
LPPRSVGVGDEPVDPQALAEWTAIYDHHNEEKGIKKNKQQTVGASSSTPQVMAIQSGRVQKKPHGKAKDLPITGKPTEVRMGRGKGNPAGWIARVSTGQIPFEMDGVSLSNARQWKSVLVVV